MTGKHRRRRLVSAALAGAVAMAGCTLFNGEVVLSGRVAELDGSSALVSVHDTGDARAGMTLTVYRVNLVPAVKHTAKPWRRPERSGSAVITEVIGMHAVRVRITEGVISTDQDVELRGRH